MEPELQVIFASVLLPFVAAIATPLAYRVLGERTGYGGAAVALACFGLVASQIGREGTVAVPWVPSLEIAMRFRVDGWALLFALLASGVGVLVFAYSAAYMHGEDNLARYYATLLAFMGSIIGVAFAADLAALFLFWELTSVCSFVLIGHNTEEDAARYSARMAMVVTVGGGLCLLAGFLLLAVVTEGAATFDLAWMLANDEAVRTALREQGLFVPALVLIGVAAAAKSAQVPLHFWLPNAMVAPTPVSAFLHSATMVKVGVYVLGRLRPLFLGVEWTLLFATLGLATMTVGAALAVIASDIKRLLAYSTASHLGLMVAGFGFRSAAGAEAGAFHLLNHALFKAALFLVAGVVAHEVGTRHLPNLGGLWRDLPVTAAVTVVAALSMAGIPPFNGFYSKELLFEAAYEAGHSAGGLAWAYPVVAVLASVLTVVYSLRFLSIFFGDRPSGLPSVHRAPVALVGPPAVLAALAAVVSVTPETAVDVVVQAAADATAAEAHEMHAGLPSHLTPPVLMSAVTVVGGVAAYPYSDRLGRGIEAVVNVRDALRPTHLYDQSLTAVELGSSFTASRVHNGLLRTYVVWCLGTASGLSLLGYATAAVQWPAMSVFDVPLAMTLVLVVALVAGVAVSVAPSHVAGVLTLSILGFMVAIFYIMASAPDLALTQLVVETLVLLIFLLVLEELPAYYADAKRFVVARDAALSLLVGVTAFVTVLLAGRRADDEQTAVAGYYAEKAVPEGGGTNIVNVILVDFRGFDTLGEIFVVTIAAISVLVLITMRNRGERR
ncbi:hydrogen gas-evolving membrane-bound hydrogenase subunit E [Halostella sp. PRR32]|uniref:hydrogen gas-evolving membrane-bound hydrogenase subunit E n=1 Tax=Halostella sp. PRR32 TaxID=3098147 RepID=UPI002B1D1E1F|nr:hydrogen gas-evolving membrane-bound hydrogenase subunit E [Halostella sp. PRR32]